MPLPACAAIWADPGPILALNVTLSEKIAPTGQLLSVNAPTELEFCHVNPFKLRLEGTHLQYPPEGPLLTIQSLWSPCEGESNANAHSTLVAVAKVEGGNHTSTEWSLIE